MSGNILNYIRNFFQESKIEPAPVVVEPSKEPVAETELQGVIMERKTVTFIVTTSIEHESDHSWQSVVRYVRKTLKDTLGQHPKVKVMRIDTKEG